MKDNVILDKSMEFAVRIVRLYQYLQNEKKEYVLSKQMVRSGTSVGANVHEGVCGQSRKDFLSKMHIAFKEATETEYWLKLLHRTGYIDTAQYDSMLKDCAELIKILSSLIKTTKGEN